MPHDQQQQPGRRDQEQQGEDGEGLSSLIRLGAKSGYEGMGTKLAGYGQYALAVYSSGMRLYASGKTPAIL